jgi:hypothetical protein
VSSIAEGEDEEAALAAKQAKVEADKVRCIFILQRLERYRSDEDIDFLYRWIRDLNVTTRNPPLPQDHMYMLWCDQ